MSHGKRGVLTDRLRRAATQLSQFSYKISMTVLVRFSDLVFGSQLSLKVPELYRIGMWSVFNLEEEEIPMSSGLPRRVATNSLGKRRDWTHNYSPRNTKNDSYLDNDSKGALQLLNASLDELQEREFFGPSRVPQILEENRDTFRVRLGFKSVSVFFEETLEGIIIRQDAVMNDGEVVFAHAMRVRVDFVRDAVRGPSRVSCVSTTLISRWKRRFPHSPIPTWWSIPSSMSISEVKTRSSSAFTFPGPLIIFVFLFPSPVTEEQSNATPN